jgi:hypothetical protein
MTITPTGQAIIKSKDDGKSYVIQANEIDWQQVGADDRQMGLEVHYRGDIEHPELGNLSWSASEYPVGMFNDADHDINGHTLEANFNFDPVFENEEDWDSSEYDNAPANLTDDQIRALSPDEQQEHLVAWFLSQFWDPAHETPYDGREGGYQYVHGGPYEAREELEEKFGGIVEEAIIENAVGEIEADGTLEWAPSPAHPDQRRAAEEYYESFRPHTLDEINATLKSGAKTILDSSAAQAAAEELRQSANALIAAIDARKPEHGGMGHNGPALDDNGNPLPDGFEHELRETAISLAQQIEGATPDPQAVVEAATRLQRLRAWLWPKVDLAADEFAKEIGKRTATAAIVIGTIALSSIVPRLDATISAALTWLQTILG